jgi:hypothetical protein
MTNIRESISNAVPPAETSVHRRRTEVFGTSSSRALYFYRANPIDDFYTPRNFIGSTQVILYGPLADDYKL